jgi:hypothetical protein
MRPKKPLSYKNLFFPFSGSFIYWNVLSVPNAIKLSTSWQDKPLAERSRSLQIRFDSAQRTA